MKKLFVTVVSLILCCGVLSLSCTHMHNENCGEKGENCTHICNNDLNVLNDENWPI